MPKKAKGIHLLAIKFVYQPTDEGQLQLLLSMRRIYGRKQSEIAIAQAYNIQKMVDPHHPKYIRIAF